MPLASWLQVGGLFAIGWVIAEELIERARLDPMGKIGLPERALAAVAGAVLFAVVLMAAHLATGGLVFRSSWIVPLAGAAVLLRGLYRRAWPRRVPGWRLGGALLVLGLLFVVPVIVGGSGVRTGDPPWHLGWTEQLLAGETVPSGPAPEFARNAYPWGLHSVFASMVRIVPGSDALDATEALHLLIVIGIPLAAASVARRVSARAGWPAAGAVALIGGFGWILARAPAFVMSPRDSRFGADLVVASPNSVYELFPPGLPRELGLVLLAASGMLLLLAIGSKGFRLWVAAGVVAGIVGLVSVPMFVSALAWTIAASVAAPRGARRRCLGAALGPALAVFALWLAPVLVDYARHGGFVSITPRLGMEWNLAEALLAWGILLPAAVGGLWFVGRERDLAPGLLHMGLATIGLLAVAIARGIFDWDLAGNATLFHQGRVWPVAHLLAAAFAGVAFLRLYDALADSKRSLYASFTVVAVLGLASPALAAIEFGSVLARDGAGFDYDRPDLQPGSFVREASQLLGPGDVVLVEGSDRLGWDLWQFSGARLATYDDPRLTGNDLRIRFADLARRWDEVIATKGFPPTHIVRALSPNDTGRALLRGSYEGSIWILVERS